MSTFRRANNGINESFQILSNFEVQLIPLGVINVPFPLFFRLFFQCRRLRND